MEDAAVQLLFAQVAAEATAGPPTWMLVVFVLLFPFIVIQTVRSHRTDGPLAGRPPRPDTRQTSQRPEGLGNRVPGTLRVHGWQASAPLGAARIGPQQMVLSAPLIKDIVIDKDEASLVVLDDRYLRFEGDPWLEKVRFRPSSIEALRKELALHGWPG